jgi:hypothetical protein
MTVPIRIHSWQLRTQHFFDNLNHSCSLLVFLAPLGAIHVLSVSRRDLPWGRTDKVTSEFRSHELFALAGWWRKRRRVA